MCQRDLRRQMCEIDKCYRIYWVFAEGQFSRMIVMGVLCLRVRQKIEKKG